MNAIEDKISRMIEADTAIRELSDEYKNVSAPIFTDQTKIPHIYDVYVSAIGRNYSNGLMKKYFTIISVILYSPKTILGAPIASGLRRSLSNALAYGSDSAITNNLIEALGWYRYVKSERDTINRECQELIDILEAEGSS